MMTRIPKIKKNDIVKVITGKDAGKTGKVLFVDRRRGRVIVEKVNMIKRHQRATRGQGGGIIEKEASIHISNVMLMNEKLGRPVRVRAGRTENGKKVRVCAKTGDVLDSPSAKKK